MPNAQLDSLQCAVLHAPPPPPFLVFKDADFFDIGGRGGQLDLVFVAGAVLVSGRFCLKNIPQLSKFHHEFAGNGNCPGNENCPGNQNSSWESIFPTVTGAF